MDVTVCRRLRLQHRIPLFAKGRAPLTLVRGPATVHITKDLVTQAGAAFGGGLCFQIIIRLGIAVKPLDILGGRFRRSQEWIGAYEVGRGWASENVQVLHISRG